MKLFLFTSAIIFITNFSAKTQDYRGIWNGYITEYDNAIHSGYILQIKEHRANTITGRAYIYGTKHFEFMGLLDFIGTIDKGNNKVTELAIVKSVIPNDTMSLCIKFLNLSFHKEGSKEVLTGKWSGASKNRRCWPGDVYLERYNPNDSTQTKRIPENISKTINEDKSQKIMFLNTELKPPVILNVSQNIISLEIKDYLKNDNDSVSVYFNRQPIISNLLITNKTYKKTLRLDKLSGLNEIIIYAENLGSIPPNTSVLVVNDGITRQKVNIFSTEQSSAVIYLNYTPTLFGLFPNIQDIPKK